MPSLGKKLCVALVLASGLVGTLAEDPHHDVPYVRSLKHARRAHPNPDSEAGPSNLTKRGPTFSGRATYYAAGLGACGNYNSGSDFIVALNAAQYGNMGQRSSWCGRTIAITYNGNTQYAQVADACPSCPYGGLDMSEGLFKAFAPTSMGVFQMSWTAADGSGGGGNNNGGNGNGNGGNNRSTSSTPAWTPRPTPTSTWTPPPTSTWTPAPSSTSTRSTTTSSSSTSTSTSTSSSDSATSTSSSSSAQETDEPGANNLDSFALIYQGLNQMAKAAAS